MHGFGSVGYIIRRNSCSYGTVLEFTLHNVVINAMAASCCAWAVTVTLKESCTNETKYNIVVVQIVELEGRTCEPDKDAYASGMIN